MTRLAQATTASQLSHFNSPLTALPVPTLVSLKLLTAQQPVIRFDHFFAQNLHCVHFNFPPPKERANIPAVVSRHSALQFPPTEPHSLPWSSLKYTSRVATVGPGMFPLPAMLFPRISPRRPPLLTSVRALLRNHLLNEAWTTVPKVTSIHLLSQDSSLPPSNLLFP